MNQWQQIAQRFAALAADKQALFLHKLDAQGIDFHQLPVIAGSHKTSLRPASAAQRELWLSWQLNPDADPYLVHGVLELNGPLDIPRLQHAIQTLGQRHEALRSHFVVHDDMLFQQVEAESPELEIIKVCDETQATEQIRSRRRQPFNLTTGPLVRLALFRLGANRHWLELCLHHSMADGWTLRLLNEELGQLYQHGTSAIDSLPLQFADLIHWQQMYLDAGGDARQRDFWRTQALAQRVPMQLPEDRQPTSTESHSAWLRCTLDTTTTQSLLALTRTTATTPATVMMTALGRLLQHYCQEESVLLGVAEAGRHWPGSDQVAGYRVQLLPLLVEASPAQPMVAAIKDTAATLTKARAHQDLPLEAMLNPDDGAQTGQPGQLLQVVFNYQSRRQPPVLDNLEIIPRTELSAPQAKFPLAFGVEADTEEFELAVLYDANRFSPQRIQRLMDHWQALLREQSITPRPTGPVFSSLPTFPWERVAEQAARQPQAEAIRCGDDALTFAQLEQCSRQLAARLQQAGIQPDNRIAVCLPRGTALFVSLLAILRAGAAYVPLDPDYPADRLQFMLNDSGAIRLITNDTLHSQLFADVGVEILTDPMAPTTADFVPPREIPERLAYLIYTSGSTGTPKAVAVSAGAISRHLDAIGRYYRFHPNERLLHLISISFDGAIEAWLGTLACGTGIIVTPQQPLGAEALIGLIHQHRIQRLGMPPSYLLQIIEVLEQHPQTLPVTSVTLGGEAVTLPVYQRIRKALPDCVLHNGYGPTETVITPLLWNSQRDDEQGLLNGADNAPYLPIGQAVAGRGLYILDEDLNPLPTGVPGELYISGQTLARGYLNRPGLTASRFLPDPFGPAGARMYRSGDRVRRREDGCIDYLGRLDHQVKLRGLRIELGEIEARLQALEGVSEAIVRVEGESPDQALAAHIAGPELESTSVAKLKSRLQQNLPNYMVPERWQTYPRLPRLPNGKLDYQALKEIAEQPPVHEPPAGEMETRLAKIWSQILGGVQPGRHDRFDHLGGHSLRRLKLQHELDRAFGYRPSLQALYQHATLAEQAQLITTGEEANSQPSPLPVTAPLPLTIAQQRQYHAHTDPGGRGNQISWHIELNGVLNTSALVQALEMLTARHDVMRIALTDISGQTHQYDSRISAVALQQEDISSLAPHRREAAARQFTETFLETPLALDQAPLWQLCLIKLEPNRHWLLGRVSHLVMDGASLSIWLHELTRLYNNPHARLAPLTSGFLDYAAQPQTAPSPRVIANWQRRLAPLIDTRNATVNDDDSAALRQRIILPTDLTMELEAAHSRDDFDLESELMQAYVSSVWALELAPIDTPLALRIPLAGKPAEAGVPGMYVDITVIEAQADTTAEQLQSRLAYSRGEGAIPFLTLCDVLGVETDARLFTRFGFNFMWRPDASLTTLNGLQVTPLAFERRNSGVDCNLVVNAIAGHSLELSWTLRHTSALECGTAATICRLDALMRATLRHRLESLPARIPGGESMSA